MLLSDQIGDVAEVKQYMLAEWKPTTYERWWSSAQKADTKAKSSANLWKARNDRALGEVRLLDAHVVGMGRNCFNPLLGTGGNVGKRDLAKAWKDSVNLLKQPDRSGWLDAALSGRADCGMPDLSSGGTWFVFANKMFNSGQGWYREGQLSPWSFLLSMEGAFLLVGGVNRRLGSRSRAYAVFPFVSEPSQPETDGEIGLARAEFWAPLWKNPATLGEVQMLLERGMARLGGRAAQAPHEFAVAALAAGVDAGISEFARYELRHTTSSQVFEAVPREHIRAEPEAQTGGRLQNGGRAAASKLLLAFISSSPVGSTGFLMSRATRNRRGSSSG
jgi:CRISPR-associated protein Csx17